MNTIRNSFLIRPFYGCFFCFIMLLAFWTPVLFTGCGSTPVTKAVQAEKILITSVNVAVKQIVLAINAGKLTSKQCVQFNTYYQDYYDAQQLAKAALEKANLSGGNSSPADVAAAQTAVGLAEQALLDFANRTLSL